MPKKNHIQGVYKNISSIIFLILFLFPSCQNDLEVTKNPETRQSAQFVGSKSCQACHRKEHSEWHGSHHEQAMKIADTTSVLGDFNNTSFKDKNALTTFFFRKEGNFYVNTQGPDGQNHDYKIEYTFGVTPLQQYVVQFPKGAYQCLLTAWDTKENKWFSLQNTPHIQPDEWMHWSHGSMTWNTMCADCHSTELKKNYDAKTDSYQTTFQEINVNCESCHGPASLHNAYHQNHQKGPKPQLHMDKSLTSRSLVDRCARCHSRREQITKVFDFKGHFLDSYAPSLLLYPTYEKDGQIRDEDYVYGSFVQSKMYHEGVSCRDCHDVHTLKLKKEGNALCLSCHEPKYDDPSHHFHKKNTEAAQCINCHMAGKFYMGNDFRRDHSFRIPRPDQSVKYGTPNACANCHKDISKWSADIIREKFGSPRPDHFSDYLLAGNDGDFNALYYLAQAEKYPEIARATALNLYANQQVTQILLNKIRPFLQDSAALLRREAVAAFTKLNTKEIAPEIEPLLQDSIRLIRIASAKYFSLVGLAPKNQNHFAQANKEYIESLEINSDFAYGQHEWALYYQAKGNLPMTIQSYQKALKIDSYYNMSRMNLALLQYQQGNILAAEKLYLKVIEQEPEFGHAYYMLGLLYNETGDAKKALHYLAKACNKEPINPRAFYNYALKLQEDKQYKKSIQIANQALSYSTDNEDFIYIKLLGEIKLKQTKSAIKTCQKLLRLSPNNGQYQQILTQLTN